MLGSISIAKPTFETRGKIFNARIIEEELKESETSIYCMHTTNDMLEKMKLELCEKVLNYLGHLQYNTIALYCPVNGKFIVQGSNKKVYKIQS